jgi:hypothetical protein
VTGSPTCEPIGTGRSISSSVRMSLPGTVQTGCSPRQVGAGSATSGSMGRKTPGDLATLSKRDGRRRLGCTYPTALGKYALRMSISKMALCANNRREVDQSIDHR